MISSSRIYDDNNVHPAYLVLWYMYLVLVSMFRVIIVVVIIVQKGSKKRKSNLSGKKTKKRNAKKL